MHDPRRRAAVAFAVGLLVLVATRLRGHVAAYVELHLWLVTEVHTLAARAVAPLVLTVTALLLAHFAAGAGNTRRALGLDGPALRGLLLGALIGLPMLVQAPFSANGMSLSVDDVHAIVTAPIAEEVFFRGLLVLVPVGIGGLRFWPFAIAAGLVFGSVHVPWDDRLGAEHLGTFAVTAAGGIWYAWLVRSFGLGLWVAIALHATMNAAWAVFDVGGDAAGTATANIGRVLTIVLGTVLALRARRRRA